MKTRTPFSIFDLSIKKGDRVLEVGPGHNPMFRSDVLLEKFIDSNYHRCGDVKIFPHQTFYHCTAEKYPFKDKEFDYVYCSNVLEHVDSPADFLDELSRVGKRGYIETPSLIGEMLFPKQSHRWCIIELDGKLILFEKAKMKGNYFNDYGEALLNYLPHQSLPYRLLQYTEPQFSFVRYEWSGSIEYVVDPGDDLYRRFFTQAWDKEMCMRMFPPRSFGRELMACWKAFRLSLKGKRYAKKIAANPPLTLSQYVEDHEVIRIE